MALERWTLLELDVVRHLEPRRSSARLVTGGASLSPCHAAGAVSSLPAWADGETEQRIYAIPVWRETPFFSPRERAALAWTEAVTRLGPEGVADAEYESARAHFEEAELARLTMAIVAINGWNRLSIAFRSEVGGYQPKRRET